MRVLIGDGRLSLRAVLRIYTFAFPIASVIALLFSSQDVALNSLRHDRTPAWACIVSWFIGLYHTTLVVPLIFFLGEKCSFDRKSWVGPGLVHLSASCLFAILSLASQAKILVSFHVFQGLDEFPVAFQILCVNGFHQIVLTYWVLICVGLLVRYYHRFQDRLAVSIRLEAQALELKVQVAAARLKALNLQIQPQFLFSTLNSITTLVLDSRLSEAEEMLGRLSDLLRWVLLDGHAKEVTLGRELKYVRLYLEIERIRFQDRLGISIDVDPMLLNAAIPYMVLQPLVEDALHLGVDLAVEPVALGVSAVLRAERLEISIRHEYGHTRPAGNSTNPDGALSISRQRLEGLYGADAELSIVNSSQGARVATLSLPYRELQ